MGNWSEIACGSIAGATGRLIEYPFDTAKVRLQTQDHLTPRFKGALDCIYQTIRAEGALGLYRGVGPPIFLAAAENAALFYSYSMLKPYMESTGLSGNSLAVAQGCGAGVLTSFILTPIELIKCRVQVSFLANRKHQSFKGHLLEVIKQEGVGALWKGQTGTLLREAGGSAAWFGSYHAVRAELDDSVASQAAAGACAGVAYNLALFPADTVKSYMQTETTMGRQSMGFVQTFGYLYRQGGFKTLYRGLGITCARAAPSSAVIFMVHDWLKSRL